MKFTEKLYTVTNKSSQKVDIILADETHPVFVSHFPGNPILPGFLQIDLAVELFNIKISKIKKTKFISIVKAKDEISFIKENNKILIKSKENNKISEITYE